MLRHPALRPLPRCLGPLLLLTATPSLAARPAQGDDGPAWRVLELPAACRVLPEGLGAAPPTRDWHVVPPLERPDDDGGRRASLPVGDLLPVLEAEARAAGRGVRLRPSGDRVLLEGPPQGLDHLQAFADALGALEQRTTVVLRGRLDRSGEGSVLLERSLPSGERTRFGRRSVRDFVGSWSAEVASDSAVAEPEVWSAHLGWSLDVVACRLPAGDGALLLGSLDLARLDSLVDFDPDTPDLGLLQVPRVEVLRLDFSGVARPDAPLRLDLALTPDGARRLTLTLEAETSPGDLRAGGFRVLDAALLASHPGGSEEGALGARDLVALLDSGLRPAQPVHAVGARLFVPASDSGLVQAAEALLADLGAPRLSTRRVTLDLGGTSWSWPCAGSQPTRLRLGHEGTHLAGYRTELATDSWLAEPEVQRHFEGFDLRADLRGNALLGELTRREGLGAGQLEARDLADLGRLVWRDEGLERGPLRVTAGGPPGIPLGPAPEAPRVGLE